MIKTLIGIQLSSVWKHMFSSSKKRMTNSKKGLIILLAVYVIGSLFATSGMLFYQLADSFASMGLGWIYFTFVGVMLLILCFMGTIFAAQSQIYDAKDNDLLLSMPIQPKHILLSRVTSLLIINYIYTSLLAIPAGVVYFMCAGVTISGLIGFIAGTALLPILSLAASCVGGWLVGSISSRMKNKNLISVALMIILLVAYLIFASNLQGYITKLLESGEDIGRSITKVLPMLYCYGKACAEGDFLQLLALAAFCIIPFLVVYMVLSKSFIKIATTKRGQVKKVYVKKEMEVTGVQKALLKKEFARFFSLPIYIMNSAIGVVFELLLAGALLFNPNTLHTITGGLTGLEKYLPLVACGLLIFCASMNCITAPSISLEGKNIGQLKSLPIDPIKIYNAKILMNIIICLPSVILAGIVFWVGFDMSVLQGVMLILTTSLVQCLAAVFGLCANIMFPKFDWVNETVAIKQSMSVIVAMFGNLAICAAPLVIGLVFHIKGFISMDTVLIIIAVCYAVMLAACYRFVCTVGKKRFAEF